MKEKIRSFIYSNYLAYREDFVLEDDTSLLEHGVIDSTGILELISFVEKEFSIVVLDDDINPDNLDTVNKLEAFIGRKKQ